MCFRTSSSVHSDCSQIWHKGQRQTVKLISKGRLLPLPRTPLTPALASLVLRLPQLNRLHCEPLPRDAAGHLAPGQQAAQPADSRAPRLPTQRTLTQQISNNWAPFQHIRLSLFSVKSFSSVCLLSTKSFMPQYLMMFITITARAKARRGDGEYGRLDEEAG